MQRRQLLIGLATLAIAGCASAPAAPPTVDVTGSWAGQWAYENASLGGGQMELALKQTGANVQGTIQMSGTPIDRNGAFSGVVAGDQLRILYPTSITGRLTMRGDTMGGQLDGTDAANVSLKRVK